MDPQVLPDSTVLRAKKGRMGRTERTGRSERTGLTSCIRLLAMVFKSIFDEDNSENGIYILL